MSHPPLSYINRLYKTESAVFKLWMLHFQRIFLQIILSLSLFVPLVYVIFKANYIFVDFMEIAHLWLIFVQKANI